MEIEIGGTRLTLPAGTTEHERITWARDHMRRFVDGKASADEMAIVRAALTGWADQGAGKEKYSAASREVDVLLRTRAKAVESWSDRQRKRFTELKPQKAKPKARRRRG